MHTGLHVKYRLLLPGFNETLILGGGGKFSEKFSNIRFREIRPVTADFFDGDGQEWRS